MKVLMKSGEKELKFGHKAIYRLKKDTGRELFDLISDIATDKMEEMKINTMYELLFAALKDEYKDIEEMLDDLKDSEFNGYIKILGDSVGKLFGANMEEQ